MATEAENSTQAERGGASDIRHDSWVLRLAPVALRPYARLMRLDRPIGTWLLLLPCWWGLALAGSAAWPGLWYGALFAAGAVVMRGAGCVVNDILDRDLDGRVARTADRPIPAGEVTVRGALVFLVALVTLGLAILLQFNWATVVLGAASLVLVFTYPLMKRITYWPQIFLGLAFNWGALMGWSAVHGRLEWPALALYAAGITWTLVYDTIYAHQDKEDDALVGVKSTALLFAGQSRRWIAVFAALTMVGLWLAVWLAGSAWPAVFALVAAAAHLVWQVARVRFDVPKSCLSMFRANRDFGLLVLAALCAG